MTLYSSPYNLQTTTFYALDLSGNSLAVYNLPSGGSIVQTDLSIFGLSRLGVFNRATAQSSYEITDHLGNVRAVIRKENNIPAIKSFADYYPFGELLPNRNSLNYRYAFQGEEIDSETGMEAFQLRLWDGRLGRWLSPDPYGQYYSPYQGMGNNPISGIDTDGGWKTHFMAWLGSFFDGKKGGTIFESEMGDFGIRYDGTYNSEGAIAYAPNFGGKRYDNTNKDNTFNLGGAGAGGMSLFGTNTNVKDLPDVYMEGHAAITQGSVGGEIKFLGARVSAKGEFAKSPLYQVGFDFDSSRGRFDGGPLVNTSGIFGNPGDYGGGLAYGGGVDLKFDGRTGNLKEITTSALVTEITNEFHVSGMNKGKILRTKMGFNLGVEASFFFGVEASFKTGFIF